MMEKTALNLLITYSLFFFLLLGPLTNNMFLVPQETEGRTRSATFKALQVKRTTSRYGDLSFSRCGPYLWNKLPLHPRYLPENQFKRHLKTLLFGRYFREAAKP
jgi:hypothetical protein